ncbi:MAG TPA: hypothetical protein VGH28_24495 [Polyangiaceae bacterium]|jgi:hypothetical protein
MNGKKLLFLAVLSAACGNAAPSNFAGSYSGTVVSGDNACQFSGWTAGNSSPFQATVTQDGADAQLQVPINSIVGLVMAAVLGTNTFTGTVSGNEFTASVLGTKQTTQGACTFTVNTKLDLTIDDKSNVVGALTYTPVTNGDPSCAALNTCSNVQNVTGSRTGP